MLLDYEKLATGRETSVFEDDVARSRPALAAAFAGRSLAVIGAAGSIGAALVKALLPYAPKALAVIDANENNLVELVRDLRASPDLSVPDGFAALPIALGSPECARFFAESGAFDHVFNLAAVKHVRSEKDVLSVMRMIDTNVLFLDDLLASLPAGRGKVFSVSTDKAANPASMMGASKRAMELVLLRGAERHAFSTARFANVAFSDGSLPFSFLRRIEKRQPIAAPSDIRRFFMSHREAGELCLLAGGVGRNREVFFPKLDSGVHEKTLAEIATALLGQLGYEPFACDSEDEAKGRIDELLPRRKWPCLFGASDTSGEKAREEFYAAGDEVDLARFAAVGVLTYPRHEPRLDGLDAFLAFARAARSGRPTKEDYLGALAALLPEFRHLETGRSLDEKL